MFMQLEVDFGNLDEAAGELLFLIKPALAEKPVRFNILV